MAIIHFVLQGKGGVGKSLVSSFLYQYLKGKGLSVKGFDTDPINNTFAGYKEFDIHTLDIMDGDDIDKGRFDQMIEKFGECSEDTHIVVDNGASSFVPLCGYLKENSALRTLEDQGHELYLHTVVTGGLALPDIYDVIVHLSATP